MNIHYRRFALANLLGLVLSGLLFIWISRDGTLDFWIAQQFFDSASQTFWLRAQPALAFWGHTVLKNATVVLWVICIALALASNRIKVLRPWRRALFTFVVMAGCAAFAIQFLKGTSVHSCPWDLQQFGGGAQWFALFGPTSATSGPGNCWPGGHASGGFALLAGYFALRELHVRAARWSLVAALSLGTVMSAVQMARGAHFLSHNLWSAWIVWAICLVVDLLLHAAFSQAGKTVHPATQ